MKESDTLDEKNDKDLKNAVKNSDTLSTRSSESLKSINSEEEEDYLENIIKIFKNKIEKNKIEIEKGNKNKFFGSLRSYVKNKKSSKEKKFINNLRKIQTYKEKGKYKGSKYKIKIQALLEKICKTLKEENDSKTYQEIDENIKGIYKSWGIESNEEGNIDHNGFELDHSIIEVKRCLVVLRKRTSLIKSGLIDDIYKSARRGYQLIKVLLGGKKKKSNIQGTEDQISKEEVIEDIGRVLKFLECMIPKMIVKLIIKKHLTLSDDDTDRNALNDLYNSFSCLNEVIFKKRYKEINENISDCYKEKIKVSIKSDDDKGKKNCKKIIDYNFNQISSHVKEISKLYSSFGVKDDNFCKDTEKKLKDSMDLVKKYYKNNEEPKSKVGKLFSNIKNKFKKSNEPTSKEDILDKLKTNLKEIINSVVNTRKKFTPNSDNNEFLEKFLIKTPNRMKKFLNKIKKNTNEETNKETSSSRLKKLNILLNSLIKIENCILSLSDIFGFGIKIYNTVSYEPFDKNNKLSESLSDDEQKKIELTSFTGGKGKIVEKADEKWSKLLQNRLKILSEEDSCTKFDELMKADFDIARFIWFGYWDMNDEENGNTNVTGIGYYKSCEDSIFSFGYQRPKDDTVSNYPGHKYIHNIKEKFRSIKSTLDKAESYGDITDIESEQGKKFLNDLKEIRDVKDDQNSPSKSNDLNKMINTLKKDAGLFYEYLTSTYEPKQITKVEAEQYSKIEEMQEDAFGSTIKIGKETFVKRTGDRLKGKVIFSNFLFSTKGLDASAEDNRTEYYGSENVSQAGDRGVMIIATVEDTSLTKLFKSYKKLVKSGIDNSYSVSHVAEVNIGAKYLNIQSKVHVYIAYTNEMVGTFAKNELDIDIQEIKNRLNSGKVYFGKSKTHYDLKDKDSSESKLNYSEFKECIHFLKENSGFSKELKKCLSRIKNHRESASFNKNLVFEDLSYAYNYIRQKPDKLEQYEEELKAELKKLIGLEDKLDDAENQDWEEIKFKIVGSEQENEEKNYMSKDKKFKKLETQFRKVREIQQKTKLYSELKRDILTNLSKLCRSMTGYSVEDLSIKEGQEKPSENMEKNQSVIKGDVLSKIPLYIGHKNSINSKNEVLHYEKFLNPGYFWTSVNIVGEGYVVGPKVTEKAENLIKPISISDRPSSDERLALISEIQLNVRLYSNENTDSDTREQIDKANYIGGVTSNVTLRFYISLKNKYIASFANKFFDVRTKILNGKLEIK